jgi:UDP-N-acetylmuramoyl-L-alanyl-D-glutamate--2,6-diaminopimelate ligase
VQDLERVTVHGDGETLIREIRFDSRVVQPGELFVALRGTEFDWHDFIPDALAHGAAAVVVDRQGAEALGDVDVPVVVVEDTRSALATMSARFFDDPSQKLNVIGITGTDGKTTTSYLVDHILRRAGYGTGLIGTVALRINDLEDRHSLRQTTPESVEIQRLLAQMVAAGCQWATLEATSHGLDQHRLDHVRFVIGGVTNITHEHLEHHKTIAAYRRAKARLFERVTEANGTAVINVDDEGAREMLRYAETIATLRYSQIEETTADLRAERVVADGQGCQFDLCFRGERVHVHLPLLGRFNVENALCATGIALAAGIPLRDVAVALEVAPSPPGRLTRMDLGQPFAVIVDYAHTPDSLAKVLRLLRGLYPGGRLIAVFGSAGDRDTTKRPLQGKVAAELADRAIITSEDPRTEDPEKIIEDIVQVAVEAGGQRDVNIFAEPDRMTAIRMAVAMARPGDCVLLAGKGHEGSIIWGHTKVPWDEEAAARTALQELGYSLNEVAAPSK